MLKRINWKAIFKGFAWLICLAGIIMLMSFIAIKKDDVKCTKIEIIIPGADNFIEREEIDAILKHEQGQLIGRNLNLINIHEIEKALKSNPYIAFAKIYADMDGVINISIKQRQPVLRVINSGGQDFYIDKDGLKMPMSTNYTANVLVATGNILEGYGGRIDTLGTPLAKDLYKIAFYFKKDTLWDSQIEQIYVNMKNDVELIPRVGNQRIILGNGDLLETKMNNLLGFYKQAMPKVGWNVYKTINLKYINQIVCVKYDSLVIKKAIKQFTLDSAAAIKSIEDTVKRIPIKEEIKKEIKPELKGIKVEKATVVAPAKSKVTEQNNTKPVAILKDKTTTKKNK